MLLFAYRNQENHTSIFLMSNYSYYEYSYHIS